MKIKDIGEFGIIDRITKKPINKDILVGIGDDAAVIKLDKDLSILTTDSLVEGDHFNRDWFSAKQIGMKSIEVNVSDVAAMGGRPKYVLISLALPKSLDFKFIKELYSGMWKICEKYGIEIIGGNMTHSEKIFITVTMVGNVKKDSLCLRSQAKPGDLVYVSRELGNGRAGLRLFQEKIKGFNEVKKSYLEPKSELLFSIRFAPIINSMIDISDGLAPEMNHICKQSKCGAIIYKEKIPIKKQIKEVSKKLNEDFYDYALFGGEDFALLYTVPKENKDKVEGFLIGEITKERDVYLNQNHETIRLSKTGYDHFFN